MLDALIALFQHDLRLGWRRRSDLIAPLGFFIIASSLFPLATETKPDYLESLAPGMIWVLNLLAMMISLDRIFSADEEDGWLTKALLAPWPPSLLVLVRAFSHWILTGLPLLFVTPLIGLMLALSWATMPILMLSLIIGGIGLSLLGTLGTCFTLGSRRASLLAGLIILPLAIPLLIFGVGAVKLSQLGQSPYPALLMEAGLVIGLCVLAPWLGGLGLRYFTHHG